VPDLDRTTNVETLRQAAKILDAEVRRLHDKITAMTKQLAIAQGASASDLETQLRLLQEQLEEEAQRAAKAYGGGSERRPRPKDPDAPPKEKKPRERFGPTPQPNLPRVEVLHELDEADRACPDCGGDLEAWKGQTEDAEEIDVIEVEYVLKTHKRQKYRCACGCIETALPPEKLVPGGRYSLDFAVHVSMEKWGYHMPIQRQVTRMRRGGLEIQPSCVWDQSHKLSETLQGAMKRLHRHILEQEVVIIDETRWPLLGAQGRKTKNWFVWGLVTPQATLYKILDGRSAEEGAQVLRNFQGIVVGDGYVVYEVLAKKAGFTLANDWCHARRRFLAAEATQPDEAVPFIDDIGKLFLVERDLKKKIERQDLGPSEAAELRAQVRDEKSKPLVNRIGERAMRIKAMRDSPIVKAVRYLDNRWDELTRFVKDGRIPITSNPVESALRHPVLGRNNHFGSRSARGVKMAETFYSLIESAKVNGLNPTAYLREAGLASIRGQTIPLPHELAGRS
jgi:transposase